MNDLAELMHLQQLITKRTDNTVAVTHLTENFLQTLGNCLPFVIRGHNMKRKLRLNREIYQEQNSDLQFDFNYFCTLTLIMTSTPNMKYHSS